MKILLTSNPDNDGHLKAYRIEDRVGIWAVINDLDLLSWSEQDNVTSQNYLAISQVEWTDFVESLYQRGHYEIQEIGS